MTTVDEVWHDFTTAGNMTPKQLEQWLASDESKAVGQKDRGGESTGHESGRRIVQILQTKKSDGGGESTGHESGRRIVSILHTDKSELTDDDAAHMRKVVGYVKRHTAQRPDRADDELEHAKWTASLKNWGHDPLG